MSELVAFFRDRTPQMVARLQEYVRYESPSTSKPHVDALGARIAEDCRALGATVTVHPRAEVGDVVLAAWNAEAPGQPILLLGHMDTVWPAGTLETMPVRVEGDILYGPGALDMKNGIVIALEAIGGLIARGALPRRPILLLINSDEETGSHHSRALIEQTARTAGLVLVLEPAAEGEALKTWRKGIAHYEIETLGRASHAGNAPEAGINAVIEAAHQALAIHALNDLPQGTSASVTLIQGGIASNVIPDRATLSVDVRFLKTAEAARVDAAIQGLAPVLPGAGVRVSGGIDRGPMERDAQMVRCYQQARAIAASLGLELREAGAGGASDGNFTAALGVPTLDGLGADGTGMHAKHEQVYLRSLHRRAALLAQMLIAWEMEQV